MAKKEVGKQIVSGLSWTFAERILAQGVSFVISVILARLLTPEDYGVISIVLVFINIANVFVTNGLGEALIQRNQIDNESYSTVFWMSLLLSVLLYSLLFFVAPFIAGYYNQPILRPVLRVLGIKVLFASINSVQHAYISKKMMFKNFFYATLGGTLTSAVVGILLAFWGFGVWALVFQYLLNTVMDTVILQLCINWRPCFYFSTTIAKESFSYGWKLTVSALIITAYNELRSLIIGKKYSSADLAYYSKGNHFPSMVINNLNSAIGKVFFPMMVSLNDNISEFKKFASKTLQTCSFIVFPILAWLIVCAEPIVVLLLTEKWRPCIPYVRILSLFWITQPLQTINWQVIKASGRSDLCFKLEIIKKIFGVLLILLAMDISVPALAWSSVIFAVISTLINMIPSVTLIQYRLTEQIIDLLPVTITTIIASIVSACFSVFNYSLLLQLLIQTVVFISSYCLLSIILCKQEISSIVVLLKKYIRKN